MELLARLMLGAILFAILAMSGQAHAVTNNDCIVGKERPDCLSIQMAIAEGREGENALIDVRLSNDPFENSKEILLAGINGKEGVRLHRSCETFYVYAWNVDESKSGGGAMLYDGGDGESGGRFEGNISQHLPDPKTELGQHGPAQTSFKWELCSGYGAIAFPKGFIVPGKSFVLVCPQFETLVPGYERGVWLTPSEFSYFERKGLNGIVMSVVVNRP